MPSAPFPLPLIGRSAELAVVTEALESAAAGRGATLVLSGEGGVGKTRLAQSALQEAARRGWPVAVGRAYAVETGVPYALWGDALLPLFRALDAGALAVLTRGGEAELARLFPGLAGANASGESAPASVTAEQKAQLHWRLAQLLAKLAAKKPLLIVLENLQWADASSLELLHFVARHLSDARVLLLCSYNETQRDENPMLRTTEQSLVSIGAATVHRVAPLTRDDTAEVLRRAFGVEPALTREFAALLFGWTRGNPFFIEETLKALVESGRLAERDGRWQGWDVDALTLPRSVRDAVLERLDRLSPGARDVANLAAVLGARVRYPVLRQLVQHDESELLGALDELLRNHVLEEASDGESYDFAHPIMQEVVYGEIGRARARLLHASVAEALETYYGGRGAEHADELAFHFARGDARMSAHKAVRYLTLAGRSALAKYANREAAGYLQHALEQLEDASPDDGASGDLPREAEVVELLARARQRLGDYGAAISLWERLVTDARRAGDEGAVARAERRLGLACYWSGHHEDALAHYDLGLLAATAAGDDDLLARLHVARGNCLQALGRLGEAREETHLALALAEGLGDDALLARVHRALLLLHTWTGPPDAAREHGARAVALAAASGQHSVEWSAHWALGMLAGLTGNAGGVRHHVAESERLADVLQSPLLRVVSAEVSIEYMSGIGQWRDALALADQSIPAARVLGKRTLLPRLLVWTGLIWRGIGDLDRARQHVEEAWELADAGRRDGRVRDVHVVVPAHTGMAGYHLAAGAWQQTIDIGEAGMELADRSGYVAWSIHRLLPFVAEASLWLGDLDRAARHGVRLRRDARQLGHALALAWADTIDALIAHVTGPPDISARLLGEAVEKLEAVPFPFDAARVRRMAAQALVAVGDREGAARELRLAHDTFARLGAERELAGTRERLRELGIRPPVKAVSAGTAGMTGRELDIARLVAQRKSNKEIATSLEISPRTVSTHLSNIFTKLGVGSRGELADLVREEGLLELAP